MTPEPNSATPRCSYPELLTVKDIQSLGIGRNMARALMNRADMPVITLSERVKRMHRDKFFAWLDAQAEASMAGMEGCSAQP